ncbi:MAG: histidine phosphatase family protein [Flavobacteriales bacterium]|nr:histidine phosphatase family protein [Flavobacteriales bacterium]
MGFKTIFRRISLAFAAIGICWALFSAFVPKEEEKDRMLYIVRHAKSDKSNASLKDIDRPLNSRGYMDAPLMGAVLKAKGVKVDLIISSPSRRTRETIIPIALAIGYDTTKIRWNKRIYRCSHSGYLEQVEKIGDQYQRVMIVGHNGASTSVANVLQKDSVISNVPTTGVVAINFGEKSWKNVKAKKGKLIFFDVPKNHK